jgi:hypothetical protein
VKKPTKRPDWDEFPHEDRPKFTADGTVYGRVERYLTVWQGTFDRKPAGVGVTKEEAKQKVEDAYERWLVSGRR